MCLGTGTGVKLGAFRVMSGRPTMKVHCLRRTLSMKDNAANLTADASPKATCRPSLSLMGSQEVRHVTPDLKNSTHLIQEGHLAVLQGDGAWHCTEARLQC